MDVNRIIFGDFSLGAKQFEAQKRNDEEKDLKPSADKPENSSNAGAFSNALDIAGVQNKIQVKQIERKEVNPSEFLDENRIADIEAMMGKFEDGVNVVANAIESEFPGFFASDAKNALAAKIYAQE